METIRPARPRRSRRRAATFLAITLIACLAACSNRDDSSDGGRDRNDTRPDILLVTLDTLREDRLKSYGYELAQTPVLDELAREGIVFERAVSPVPLTVPAHASMLTGAYPFQLGARTNESKLDASGFETAAELLGEAGYDCAAFIGAVQLDRLHGLDRGFAVYDDAIAVAGRQRPERRAEEVVAAFAKWHGERTDEHPFFAWVHFYDPHETYDAPPPFGGTGRDPYDEEISYSDAQVGALLDIINSERASDTTRDLVTLVTSDHGESLGEHGENTHGLFIYGATVDIPLIVHSPNRLATNKRVSELVRLIDIAPSLLELAGEPDAFPETLPARSFAAALQPNGTIDDRPAFAESIYAFRVFGYHPITALVDGRYKIIDSPEPELYNLDADPDELRNLAASDPERRDAMLADLRELFARYGVGETAFAEIDAARRDQLLELGYVVGELDSTTSQTLSPEGLPDVKTIRPFLSSFEAAMEQLMADDPAFPSTIVRVLSEHRPRSPYIYRQMLKYLEPFDAPEAKFEVLRFLVDVTPAAAVREDPRAHLQLGYQYMARKQPEPALALFETVLEQSPEQLDALAGLGQVHLNLRQDRAAAKRAFEAFLRHAPETDARRAQIRSVVDRLNRP